MNPAQSMDRSAPDDDFGQATFRELIVQLALAEDERRKTSNPDRIAALNQREQAIAAALHNNGPGLAERGGGVQRDAL